MRQNINIPKTRQIISKLKQRRRRMRYNPFALPEYVTIHIHNIEKLFIRFSQKT